MSQAGGFGFGSGLTQKFTGFSGSGPENRVQNPEFSGRFGSGLRVGSIFARSTCNYCSKVNHTTYSCTFIKPHLKIIQIWVPKGTKPPNMVARDFESRFNAKSTRRVWVFVLQVCLKSKKELWYVDSGCSRHMSDNATLFTEIKKKEHENVTFRDKSMGNICLLYTSDAADE